MVQISKITGALTAAALFASAGAHPGETHQHDVVKRQIAAREHLASHSKRALDNCANSPRSKQLKARSIARRAQVAQELRQKRGITASMYSHNHGSESRRNEELI